MSSRLLISWACVVTASVTAPVAVGVGAPAEAAAVASQTCAQLPAGAAVQSDSLAAFTAASPRRLVDTRVGTGGLDAPIGAECTLRLDVGAAAVPEEAAAVALSVTALGSQPGFLTVFPCSAGRPETSNINTRAGGFPTPNLVVAIPDAARRVCIYSLFEAEVIVDLTGWWTEDGDQRLTTIPPARAVDTRDDPGREPVLAETTRTIPLAGFIPSDATAVVGNLTVTEPQADGFMTAFPCGSPVPLASNLNYRQNESRAVAVAVGLGAGAELCVRTSAHAHVVFDVSGYYSPTPQFGPVAGLQPLSGRRVADSRTGEGGWTGKFPVAGTRRLRPTSGLPNDAQSTAVVVNVIVTQAEGDGFVTLYPCGGEVPNSSAVNYSSAGESTNMVVVDLSSSGEICVFALTPAHVVVDLFGVLTADAGVLAESLTLDAFTWPGYRPDATDYAVECTGSSTEIDLELLRSTTARLNGVPVGSGTVDLPTATDDRFRLELRRGSTVQHLSFRCVPPDFPRMDVERPGNPAPGWYVTTVRTPGSGAGYATVLDHFGAPVWYKRVPGDLSNVELRSDGRLLMVQALGPRYGVDPDRGFAVASLFGTVVDELLTVPDPLEPSVVFPTDHHDFVALAGGARAMLSYPVIAADLAALGPGYSADDEIADGVIQEISADDELLWTWRTSDHFGYDVSYPVRWGPLEGYAGDEVDIFHLNSLQQVTDGSGDYVVSARHMDNVFRVDRATGDVDWVLGQVPGDSPAGTLAAQLTILGDPRDGPRRPHDARLNGDVLTLFDNRTDTGEPARAVAYRIDAGAETATLLWQIEQEAGLSSVGLGSTRVTPAGTAVISWGGAVQPVFGEYTLDGDPLIEITQVAGGNSYRIAKEPFGALSRDLLRATAGGTVDVP